MRWFNKNRCCIEIGGRTEVFTVRCSLIKTDVVLKFREGKSDVTS